MLLLIRTISIKLLSRITLQNKQPFGPEQLSQQLYSAGRGMTPLAVPQSSFHLLSSYQKKRKEKEKGAVLALLTL